MEIRYEQELANNDLEYQAGLIANDNSINNIIEIKRFILLYSVNV